MLQNATVGLHCIMSFKIIVLGGPMLLKPDDQWIQHGVLHGGIVACKSNKYPSIFNRLTDAANLEWIQENAKGLVGKNCFNTNICQCHFSA